MSDTNSKPIEIATLVVSILNIVLIGIGGYFFVAKYQAEMYQSATGLNAIQSQLTEVQIKIAESNARVESLSKNADLAEKSIFLLESIKPVFDFTTESSSTTPGRKITLTFTLKNNGKFELRVIPVRLLITRDPIRNNLAKILPDDVFSEKVDLIENDTVRGLDAGETRRHSITVSLEENYPREAHYFMEYRVETNQDIVKIVDEVARQWDVASVVSESIENIYRYGAIRL